MLKTLPIVAAILLLAACGDDPIDPMFTGFGFDVRSMAFHGKRSKDLSGWLKSQSGALILDVSSSPDICGDWRKREHHPNTETWEISFGSETVGPGAFVATSTNAPFWMAHVRYDDACGRSNKYEQFLIELDVFDPVPGGRAKGRIYGETISAEFDAEFCEPDRATFGDPFSCE